MASPSLVIVGRDGWIGGALADAARSWELSTRAMELREEGIDVADPDAPARLRSLISPGPDVVVVNAAGLVAGSDADLATANVALPTAIAAALRDTGAHLVHIGSAAEYGDPGGPVPIPEARPPEPLSAYGRTKAAGTLAVRSLPGATVLRPFNLVAARLPALSPLADIRQRVIGAVRSGAPVTLDNADTVRDFVSMDFLCRSVHAAALQRPAGVFNLCSGSGVRFRDLVRRMGERWEVTVEVRSLGRGGVPVVIGDPTRWAAATGLRQQLRDADVADLLMAEQTPVGAAGSA